MTAANGLPIIEPLDEDLEGGAPPEARADPLLGTLLQEKYEVVRPLGRGGMGTVYEGLHTLIGRRVAIKTLHPQYAEKPAVVERFQREARAATAIGNEHIIEVTDLGRLPDGGVFLVLELLEGTDLGALLDDRGPQPVGRVAHVVSQMCEALTAAHAKGIVHRDLKPENVFLIQRGTDPWFVKVLDFGISKFRDSEHGAARMTQTGVPIGTPYFMAPEQAQGRKDVDHRADIYSLGVILFVALSGEHPFEHESLAALFVKILSDPPPDLAALRPDLPPEIVALVHRMLEKDPAKRPQSCAEVRRALAPFVDRDAPDLPGSARPSKARIVTPSVASGHEATVASGETDLARGGSGGSTDPVPGVEMDARAGSSPEARVSAPEVPTSNGARRAALAGAVAVALVGGGIAWAALAGPAADDAPAPVAPAASEPVEVDAPAPTGEADARPAEVRVRLMVEPADAQLAVDGAIVVAPYLRYVAPGPTPHTVVATREGYVTLERELRFDRPIDETLSLQREEGPAPGRGRRGHVTASAPAPAPTTPVATTAPEAPPAEPPPREPRTSTPDPTPSILPVGPAIRDPI